MKNDCRASWKKRKSDMGIIQSGSQLKSWQNKARRTLMTPPLNTCFHSFYLWYCWYRIMTTYLPLLPRTHGNYILVALLSKEISSSYVCISRFCFPCIGVSELSEWLEKQVSSISGSIVGCRLYFPSRLKGGEFWENSQKEFTCWAAKNTRNSTF